MTSALKVLRSEDHISVSSLNTYLRCPRQYEHRYILGTSGEHRTSALAFGTAIHEALAAYYTALRDKKSPPDKDKLSAVFRDAWRHQLEGGSPVLFSDKESADSLTETGISMLECFLECADLPHRVTDVEMPFAIELIDDTTGEHLPRLLGVFDAVVQEEDGKYRILEHKTAARRWPKDKLAFDSQITAYHVAASLMGLGEAIVSIQLLLKTKKPGMEVYTPIRSKADRADFMEMALGVVKAVKAGAFYPKRDWWCNGCEYASRCVAG